MYESQCADNLTAADPLNLLAGGLGFLRRTWSDWGREAVLKIRQLWSSGGKWTSVCNKLIHEYGSFFLMFAKLHVRDLQLLAKT